MSLFSKLAHFIKPHPANAGAGTPPAGSTGCGFLVFEHTGDVIKAEQVLKAAGLTCAVKAPPAELRSGCDLVIEFPLLMQPLVMQALTKNRLTPLQIVPVKSELLAPVSVYRHTDYGGYLMVRAANMKITVEKSTLRIVNISGGGCPDVPFLAALLVGKTINEAPAPLEYGQTLCGYALDMALNEVKAQLA